MRAAHPVSFPALPFAAHTNLRDTVFFAEQRASSTVRDTEAESRGIQVRNCRGVPRGKAGLLLYAPPLPSILRVSADSTVTENKMGRISGGAVGTGHAGTRDVSSSPRATMHASRKLLTGIVDDRVRGFAERPRTRTVTAQGGPVNAHTGCTDSSCKTFSTDLFRSLLSNHHLRLVLSRRLRRAD